jgi:hypothetical protein
MTDFYECSNELWIPNRKFIYQLSDYQFFKKESHTVELLQEMPLPEICVIVWRKAFSATKTYTFGGGGAIRRIIFLKITNVSGAISVPITALKMGTYMVTETLVIFKRMTRLAREVFIDMAYVTFKYNVQVKNSVFLQQQVMNALFTTQIHVNENYKHKI